MTTIPDRRRVLSIRQPWAFLILRPDLPAASPERADWQASRLRKDIENRTWGTNYRGPLWIHAGLTFDVDGYNSVFDAFPELREPLKLARPGGIHDQRGGIVGCVRLVNVTAYHESVWYGDKIAWILGEPVSLPLEPLRGRQGLFIAGDQPAPEPVPKTCKGTLKGDA